MIDWWLEVISKPKMQWTVADEVISWLVPILIVSVMAVIILGMSWLIDKIKKRK